MTATSRNILIIDDDPEDILLLKEGFAETGAQYFIREIHKGSDAYAYLDTLAPTPESDVPQLILLDLQLPEADGLELIQAIRAHKALRMIPIIILTGSDDDNKIGATYSVGANCCIKKPRTLRDCERITQAIETFWFSVLQLPHHALHGR